jgi:hypothetical protein
VNLQHQRWEFGSVEWVQYAAGLGVALLEQSGLDIGEYAFWPVVTRRVTTS